jgi:carbamoyl-phosphate synthase large subunit
MNTDKFPNVDKSLGPEMKSTGERFTIKGLKGPFFKQVYAERSMYLSR